MSNIIDVINSLGKEVEDVIDNKKTTEYFKYTIILYSVTENFLKFLVATQECWDESGKQIEKSDKGQTYDVDFGNIREKAKNYRFKNAIDKAKAQKLIPDELYAKIDKVREERNDFIHELWIFSERDNAEVMLKMLLNIRSIVIELTRIFEKLVYDEIGLGSEDDFLKLL